MPRRPLHCRVGRHAGHIITVRHMVRLPDGRSGSLVSYRCLHCGRRYRRWTDRYLWRLADVQRRSLG